MKKRVTGIGGIFFKSKNKDSLREWYSRHLGIESETWGAVFKWRQFDDPSKEAYTVWSPMSDDSDYFQPSNSDFMVNYQVEDLVALLEELRKEGVHVFDKVEESEFGKFGWIMDPDGRKIELWEPPASDKG